MRNDLPIIGLVTMAGRIGSSLATIFSPSESDFIISGALVLKPRFKIPLSHLHSKYIYLPVAFVIFCCCYKLLFSPADGGAVFPVTASVFIKWDSGALTEFIGSFCWII